MDYATLRHIHISCAALSITLFVLRAALTQWQIDWRRSAVLRVLPHANDTVLLLAAITLAVHSGQYPLAQSWLTAKVAALLVYIGLGRYALRAGAPTRGSRLALLGALCAVGYIVGVALTRSARWGLGG